MKAALLVAVAATARVQATGLVGMTCDFPPPPPVNCELYTAVSDVSPWSACADDGTGKYYRTKVLGIKTQPQNNGTPCPPEDSPLRKIKELCTPFDCVINTPSEDTNPFGTCEDRDGSGKFYKYKTLGIKTPATNGGTCDPKLREYRELCDAVNCVINTPAEDTNPFGECEDRDGSGKFYKYKTLGIKTPASNGGTCDPKLREYKELCEAVDCVVNTPAEDTGAFGQCEDKDYSGKYYKYRVLGIKTPASNGGKACPAVDSPLREDKVFCEPVDCVALLPSEDPGPFGECEDRNNTNVFYKYKTLGVKTPESNGGKCDPKDREYKELCAAVPCVINTPAEDTGNYTECMPEVGAYSGKYYKYRVLGVKTPPQYGGSCPLPTDPIREDKVLCPAENCIHFTPEEDMGEYGPCTLVAGKWIKSKELGVRVKEKYGGTCEKEVFSQDCKAVDCVLNTEDEDPAPFGNCTDRDGTNKYYKYKNLGIKTPALYGGTECPPEGSPVREVKQFCEPVDCVAKLPSEDDTPFGDCVAVNGTDVYYKNRTLAVKTPEYNGGKCDPKDRQDSVLCPAVPCVINKPEEDKGNFTECMLEVGTYSGKYYKYRVLGVKTPAQYGGSCPLPTDPIREDKVLCPAEDCIHFTPEEDMGEYGECKLVDGKWIKSKELGVRVKEKYGGTCKPEVFSQPCKAVDCVLNTEDEDTGAYGNCTDRDGSNKYYKYKNLGIKTPPLYGGTECPPEGSPVREVKQFCEPVNCVPNLPSEDNGPFGNCTEKNNTGKYYKYKVLGIKVPAVNGGSCDVANRTISEFCPPVDCVAVPKDKDTTPWGPCTKEDGYSNKYYKYKILAVQTPAQNGGKCDPKDRTVKEFCPPVNCVPLSKDEDKGPWGPCKKEDGYSNKYYKYKVLGIKTPEQNGGTCDPKDRTISEFCPPENCIPVLPKDDKNPFGPCTKNSTDGKYYKSKTLDVKVDAKYGGTCLDKDRQYSERCPPVNCVVNTPAEDKGEFSKCKLIGNEYYKTKVLGIKTQAQYGGTCPSEADRTIKQLCPNDGYCLPSDQFYDICIPKLAQCGPKRTSTVYKGNTISETTGLALWECCDKCANTAGCVGYTFLTNKNPKETSCCLKWDIDEDDDGYVGVISSEPKSPKQATCTYHDERTLWSIFTKTLAEYKTDDLDYCCTKCKATRGCKAFIVADGVCSLESTTGVRTWWLNSRVGYV